MSTEANDGLIRWSKFLADLGIDSATGFRWRRQGILTPTVNIHGKWFLTKLAAAEFLKRAEAGEFAKTIVKPKRK